MPAKVSLAAGASVTAGFANDVEDVNQYTAVMYAPTAIGASLPRRRDTPQKWSTFAGGVVTSYFVLGPSGGVAPPPWLRLQGNVVAFGGVLLTLAEIVLFLKSRMGSYAPGAPRNADSPTPQARRTRLRSAFASWATGVRNWLRAMPWRAVPTIDHAAQAATPAHPRAAAGYSARHECRRESTQAPGAHGRALRGRERVPAGAHAGLVWPGAAGCTPC